MRSIQLTLTLIAWLVLSVTFAAPRAVDADENPFLASMAQLGRDTEDMLYFLLRDDWDETQHAAIDLRRSLRHTLHAAEEIDLTEREMQYLRDMLDDAEELVEQVEDRDLRDAHSQYIKIVENCFACHTGD